MSNTVSLSLVVTREKADELERLAANRELPVSALLQEALNNYLELQRWQIEHINKGIEQLREGKGIPHEEIKAWLETWGTDEEGEPSR